MLIKLNTCEPQTICLCENKGTDQRFCFHSILYLYFLNPKFQASSYLQCLYSLVCVGPEENHIVGFLVSRLMFFKGSFFAYCSLVISY